tara:strand:+ start:496 stop:894 length:399 start_codon:yes stop_codon:yes gene_type:complete
MWQVAAVLGAALVMGGMSFKVYYDRAEAEKDALRIELQTAVNNQKVLEGTIQDQNDRIIQAIQEQKQQQEQIQGLQEKNREAAKEVSSLRQKFARHDLNNLSLRKPGLIEKIVNKATKEVGDELAQITDPNR